MESPLSFTAGELEAQRGEVPCSGSTEARPLTPEVGSPCIHRPTPGLGPASSQPEEASYLPQRSVFFFFWLCWIFIAAQAFSSCSQRGLLFVVVLRLVTAVASLVPRHGL